MNNLLHRDSDFQHEVQDSSGDRGDREITLGTTMILAIFFALAVFAAIFFGFGYSMGSKRSVAAALPSSAAAANGAGINTNKPAAGSPLNSGLDTKSVQSPREAQVDTVAASSAASTAPAKHSSPAPVLPQPASAVPALPAASQPVVQIAAVSHQEDANLLVSTLKRRGYAVSIRNDARDKLLHVQVGPFATRQDAETMRQRLIADGFNAIVKDPNH